MVARLGVVTGQGLSDLIRERFGVRWTLFAMVVLLVANVANTVANFGGAAACARHLRHPEVDHGAGRRGRDLGPRAVRELSDRRAGVPARDGRVPRLPDRGRPLDRGLEAGVPGDGHAEHLVARPPRSLLLLVAVVGTTITPYMQFYLQSAVAEKGIGEEELPLEQADAVVGSVWTNVIAIFIVVAIGGRAWGWRRRGHHVGGGRGAGPRAGRGPVRRGAVRHRAVRGVRARGDDHAALDGVRDLRGVRLGERRRQALQRRADLLRDLHARAGPRRDRGAAGARGRPGRGSSSASQNLQGILLPIVLVFIVLLVNDRRLMGSHANRRGGNVLGLGRGRRGRGAQRASCSGARCSARSAISVG